MLIRSIYISATAMMVSALASLAEVRVTTEHVDNSSASGAFRFEKIPPPARNDAAAGAAWRVADGRLDPNSATLAVLSDGRLPREEDEPASNCFFAGNGGLLLLDLGRAIEIGRVSTFSWHPGGRGPQSYTLYASAGTNAGFVAEPKGGTDPAQAGWQRLAQVDTKPASGELGGQYGANVTGSSGSLGSFRYLLFDIRPNRSPDGFGNTFLSEIDVIDREGPALQTVAGVGEQTIRDTIETPAGRIVIDTSEAPDLTDWARKELAPVVREWYPKLTALLGSEGFEAPKNVSIQFSATMKGVAATGGSRIRGSAAWYRNNLKGEAVGSIVHELVHVVQQYGQARRTNRQATRNPGWLVEGLTDYIRWYIYEPESRGAEIAPRNLEKARYDASYRVTANFLNYVVTHHDRDLARKLNTVMREGRYLESWWKEDTGLSVQELAAEWKASLEKAAGPRAKSEKAAP